MSTKATERTKRIAFSGLLLALVMIFLYAESILPTARLSLYALSSFMVSLIIMKHGVKAGWIFYMASCISAFILIPDKLGLIPYAAFFGVYGLVKYYIEKIKNLLPQLMLKLLFYNMALAAGILFMREFLFEALDLSVSIWVIAAVSEIVFPVYDYAYSMFISFSRARLGRYFRK